MKKVKNIEIVENNNNEIENLVAEKLAKKQEQNKRVWLSCDMKGHFGCMVPNRYLERVGTKEKLVCPVCGRQLKSKDDQGCEIELAANN